MPKHFMNMIKEKVVSNQKLMIMKNFDLIMDKEF